MYITKVRLCAPWAEVEKEEKNELRLLRILSIILRSQQDQLLSENHVLVILQADERVSWWLAWDIDRGFATHGHDPFLLLGVSQLHLISCRGSALVAGRPRGKGWTGRTRPQAVGALGWTRRQRLCHSGLRPAPGWQCRSGALQGNLVNVPFFPRSRVQVDSEIPSRVG